MKRLENILLIGGVVFVGLWLYNMRRKPKVIDINPPIPSASSEPKTIYLNMANTRRNRNFFPDSFAKDYNASQEATVAPAKVKIMDNFYDV